MWAVRVYSHLNVIMGANVSSVQQERRSSPIVIVSALPGQLPIVLLFAFYCGCVRKVLSDRSVQSGIAQVERSESRVGWIWSFCAFTNVWCQGRWSFKLPHTFLEIPMASFATFVYVNWYKKERSVFGDRSKLPTEPTHFRTQWVHSDQTPPTFRPFIERICLRSDRSDWTNRRLER
jgi:hypothetical protein